MKKRTRKKIIGNLLVIALVFAISFSFVGDRAMAILNEDELVRYSSYASRNNISVSTLFVGTYLIHIDALTDELYQKALDSASDTDQMNIYYKSEIGDGLWYDVTDAESLNDIMNSAFAIPESELADLFVQYYVGSDGVMIDVADGREVNPFDIPNPYDLTKLPELEPLWMQYTNSQAKSYVTQDEYLQGKNSDSTGNKRVDIYNYQILSAFFSMNLRDSVTDGYDADLKRLYEAYKRVKAEGKQEEAQILYTLMSNVDAARRSVVMDKLAMLDENALGVMYDLASGKYYTTSGDFKSPGSFLNIEYLLKPAYIRHLEQALMGVNGKKIKNKKDDEEIAFQGDANLLSAIGDSMEKCQESYYSSQAKALVDGDSVLGHAQYAFSRQVIDEITTSGVGNSITYLRDVQNISENIVRNAESEIYLLDRSLLSLAENQYQAAVIAGVSEDYKTQIARGGSAAAAENALNTEMDELEGKRTELEFLIDAYRMRASAADGLLYVKGCISWASDLYQLVPDDDFRSRANGSIDSHINWLSQTSDAIRQSDESLKSNLDKLYDQKAVLQQKRDQALDDNDLATARMYDSQIAALDRDIAAEAARIGKSGDSEIINKILNEALEELAENPKADVTNSVAALNGLQAFEALEKLYSRLDDAGNSSGSEYRTGKNADQKRAAQILQEALDKLTRDPDADVSDSIIALYGMGAEDTLNQLFTRLDELGNSSGAEYRPETVDNALLAEQKLEDALNLLDQDPRADVSGTIAILKALGDRDALNELYAKQDSVGNSTGADLRSPRDSVGERAEQALADAEERLAGNPNADMSGTVALLTAMGEREVLEQLLDRMSEAGNNTGREFRGDSVSPSALADKIANDAQNKLRMNSKADVSDEIAALNEMREGAFGEAGSGDGGALAGKAAKDALNKLFKQLDKLNNTSGSDFRKPEDSLGKLADQALTDALGRLTPTADVSDTVALLTAMGDTDALEQLYRKMDEVGNTSGSDLRSGSVSSSQLADKVLSNALSKLNSNPRADVTDLVAALTSLRDEEKADAQSAKEALSKLGKKLDELKNSSGSAIRSGGSKAADIERLAENSLSDAQELLNTSPKADVSGTVALLKAMGATDRLKQLTDRLDQAGNRSGSEYLKASVNAGDLADKLLNDTMTKLSANPRAEVSAALAALAKLSELGKKVLSDALEQLSADPKKDVSGSIALLNAMEEDKALKQLTNRLDQNDNTTGAEFSSSAADGKALADKILKDALGKLTANPKANVSAAVAALQKVKSRDEAGKTAAEAALTILDEKLKELSNASGIAVRSGEVSDGMLVDKLLKDALKELEKDPKQDMTATLAALKKMEDSGEKSAADAIETLDEKLTELGNSSGGALRPGGSTPSSDIRQLAEEELKNALTKLSLDSKTDVSDSVAILVGMQEKDLLKKLTDKLDHDGNTSGAAYRSDTVSGKTLTDKILNDALTKLASDPRADVTSSVAALKTIKDKDPEKKTDADSALSRLDKKLDDLGNVSGASMRPGGDPGSGSTGTPDSLRMTEDEIRGVLQSEFGKSIDAMDAEEMAEATVAVSRFAKNGNVAARSLAATLSSQMRAKNSKYLYNQYAAKTPEYVNLKTVGLCTAYRYFYDISKRTATMTEGAKVMSFRSGSDTVMRSGKEEKLSYSSVMDGDVCISSDDAKALFGCTAEYISNTQYAVLLTGTMQGRAEEVLGSLME